MGCSFPMSYLSQLSYLNPWPVYSRAKGPIENGYKEGPALRFSYLSFISYTCMSIKVSPKRVKFWRQHCWAQLMTALHLFWFSGPIKISWHTQYINVYFYSTRSYTKKAFIDRNHGGLSYVYFHWQFKLATINYAYIAYAIYRLPKFQLSKFLVCLVLSDDKFCFDIILADKPELEATFRL